MIGQSNDGNFNVATEDDARHTDVPLEVITHSGLINRAFVNDEVSQLCKVNNNDVVKQCSHADGCQSCSQYGMLMEQLKMYYPTVASQLITGVKESPVKMIWQDVSVSVDVRSSYLPFAPTIHKQVLKSVNGSITAGALTALMGPSGAGKTTLLNSMCGKLRAGVTGVRVIQVPKSQQSSLRIGFVPQQDALFPQFTVQETILFASKLTNVSLNEKEQKQRVESILGQLDLMKVSNQKVDSLSGGQLKRTCIAVELISNPKILILDEPTTGLDSSNAENVISLLKNLVLRAGTMAPAIVATIHQPSYDLFEMFDTVYLLSRNGYNIYSGPPTEIMDYFEKFGFEKKMNVNPADYAVEIANAKYGTDQFDTMQRFTYSQNAQNIDEKSTSVVNVKVARLDQKIALPFLKQFYMLMARSFNAYMFKSSLMMGKFILNLALAIFLCSLFQEPVGRLSGCWTDVIMEGKPNYTDETEALKNVIVGSFEKNEFTFDQTKNVSKMISAINFIFILLMYYIFTFSVSAVLLIPNELKVVTKELSNSWYGVTAYYVSKVVSDFVFFFVTAIVPIVYSFYASEQVPDMWRCLYLILFVFLLTASWEAKGAIVGIFCTFDQIVAVTVNVGLMFPVMFLSGFFILEEKLADWIKPMTVISDIKYSFRGVMLSLYGYSRCEKGHAIEGLFDQFEEEVTTFKLFNIAWSSLNFTRTEMRRFETVLDMKSGFLDPMYDAFVNYYGESSVATYDDEVTYQPSYILDANNLDESMFSQAFTYCMVNLIILKLLIFPILYWKTRTNRL